MALKLALPDTPTGVAAPNAYHRVQEVRLTRLPRQLVITVYPYLDQAAGEAGRALIAPQREHVLSGAALTTLLGATAPGEGAPSGLEDWLKRRAYTYLKGLPEFQGATDV